MFSDIIFKIILYKYNSQSYTIKYKLNNLFKKSSCKKTRITCFYIEKSIFPNLDVIIYIEYFKKQDSDVILTGKKIDKDKFTSEISLLSFSVVMSYLGLFNFFNLDVNLKNEKVVSIRCTTLKPNMKGVKHEQRSSPLTRK